MDDEQGRPKNRGTTMGTHWIPCVGVKLPVSRIGAAENSAAGAHAAPREEPAPFFA